MVKFGLITEGPSDQIIIENILAGFFNNDDIPVNPLQPVKDNTDISRTEASGEKYGNWLKVFEYCRLDKFKQAFQFVDYVIIQIDTDVSEEKHYDVSKRDKATGTELSPQELIEKVIEKLVSLMSSEFYEAYKEKIIFAISVDSIECWLLPIYYPTVKSKSGKTANCLGTLNEYLSKHKSYSIDKKNKNLDYYIEISEPFQDRKLLRKLSKLNPSFNWFIEHLASKNIKINSGQ